jgi:prepilin-type processing-associated H-X9-DG protein
MFQVKPQISTTCGILLAQTSHEAMNVLFGDGSVRTLSSGVDPTAVWWALLTPNGGEVIPNF